MQASLLLWSWDPVRLQIWRHHEMALVTKAGTIKVFPGHSLNTGTQPSVLQNCWNVPGMSLSQSNSVFQTVAEHSLSAETLHSGMKPFPRGSLQEAKFFFWSQGSLFAQNFLWPLASEHKHFQACFHKLTYPPLTLPPWVERAWQGDRALDPDSSQGLNNYLTLALFQTTRTSAF